MESVITFDGSVSITHRHVDGSVYHNFSHEECFDVISRDEFDQTVSFTFTDADYDYAAAHAAAAE